MSFAQRRPDGRIEHIPAAVDADGRALTAGYDFLEGVTKVAMMVWNPDLLAWERATSAGGSGGSGSTSTTTRRTDVVSDTLMYVGDASPGTVESATGWVIKRFTFDSLGNPTSMMIATGTWLDRAGLTYT